jgi:ribonuclease HII
MPQNPFNKGDGINYSIAAASIVAKVHRDALMRRLHEDYPLYDFASHKGYGTPVHLEALRRIGPAPVHRRTFAHTEPPLAPAGDC